MKPSVDSFLLYNPLEKFQIQGQEINSKTSIFLLKWTSCRILVSSG